MRGTASPVSQRPRGVLRIRFSHPEKRSPLIVERIMTKYEALRAKLEQANIIAPKGESDVVLDIGVMAGKLATKATNAFESVKAYNTADRIKVGFMAGYHGVDA